MRVLDSKIRKNLWRYLFQSSAATLSTLALLLFLDVLSHTAIIATLGATAFIVFAMPTYPSASTRSLVGGYLVGVSAGCLCSRLSSLPLVSSAFAVHEAPLTVLGAVAVGIAIFLMVMTNTEHPPAAGMSLGLVLNEWDYGTVAFIFGAVILLAIVRRLLRRVLIDLV
jgi:CBS-domain-containing membrane protein